MKSGKKSVDSGESKIFNTEVIYSRVMCLLSIDRVKLEEVLRFELSPIPLSIFQKNGEMRPPNAKSELKEALKVTTSQRNQTKPEVIIVDGCAKFWDVRWPTNGTVRDLAYKMYQYVTYQLSKENSDVFLIFDRYFKYSIKGATRDQRTGNISHNHILSLDSPLPTREIVMKSSKNKIQVIDIVSKYIIEMLTIHRFSKRFVVTCSEATPIQVENGVITTRDDLKSYHEEADVNIIKQAMKCAEEGQSPIKVICDDTDVFVLLASYVHKYSVEALVVMESFSDARALININQTAEKHADIMPSLIAAHALSGCDSVPKMLGIGKKKVKNALKKGYKLESLGNINASEESILEDSTKLIAACYGIKLDEPDLSKARFFLWAKRTKKKLSTTLKPPKLESLPPTTEVFLLNVLRAHYQACIWNSCLDERPPEMDPTKYGWTKDDINECLLPTMFPESVFAAPDAVLQMIKCNCASESPCSRQNCTCASAKLSCNKFCKCYESENTCCNEWTNKDDYLNDDEEENENEDVHELEE
ncbi:uncharacterized protein [Clytia hemisphaerica]|uniref:uncharacterized protein n=2 Tax=Clytia hemisphaerica TaxID=252671 RepID=UPI0034D7736F